MGFKYSNGEKRKVIRPLLRKIKALGGRKTKIIGIQGGQGTGKSTLGKFLQEELTAQGLKVQRFSIDDFYTSYIARRKLAKKFKDNPFYQIPRGMPGTHRVNFLLNTLQRIKAGKPFSIPRFDKSLHNAAGDISGNTRITKKQDFIIFEGWCVGLPNVSPARLLQICKKNKIGLPDEGSHKVVLRFTKEYQKLWKYLDFLIMLKPDSSNLHKKWRYQQEVELKKKTGRGMSKHQISHFVNPYLPFTYVCYELLKPNLLVFINEKHRFYKLSKRIMK